MLWSSGGEGCIGAGDTNKLNKLIRKAANCSLNKLLCIMASSHHPLHHLLERQQRKVGNKLIGQIQELFHITCINSLHCSTSVQKRSICSLVLTLEMHYLIGQGLERRTMNCQAAQPKPVTNRSVSDISDYKPVCFMHPQHAHSDAGKQILTLSL